MIDAFKRTPARTRIRIIFWLMNAAMLAALLIFALRGWVGS